MAIYDVIVAGAGHAGTEAALAVSRMGLSCLIVTTDLNAVARMSCNPAIGGVAKGQITREIDALGGEMAKAIDATGIQFRMLNLSKGPAMHSPRAQADRVAYTAYMKRALEEEANLDLLQDTVTGIEQRDGIMHGVRLLSGRLITAKAAILTCGTFLNGLIHIGMDHYPGGRTIAEPPVTGLTENLIRLGFEAGRLKTGTPPRIDRRSVDYSRVAEQKGDENPPPFSFSTATLIGRHQLSCYITHSSERTHEILKTGFDRSPLFTGKVRGVGPRYCPSIEDKIFRFPDRTGHHIFLEPEGFDTNEMYVNGFSTSLPEDIQIDGLRSIEGLEEVKLIRAGYAIEYDYFPPYQIHSTLETKRITNLYFAGQINGTSGYEEAAAQGLLAGINAAAKILKRPSLHLKRSDAYIGVLIDDLVTKEMKEPYRMFTSSAEHRLMLRHDNADIRLMHFGYKSGLISDAAMDKCRTKITAVGAIKAIMDKSTMPTDTLNSFLSLQGRPNTANAQKLSAVIKRPGVTLEVLTDILPSFGEKVRHISMDKTVHQQVEIDLKYEGYLKRELLTAEKIARFEALQIPSAYNYRSIKGLSAEGMEKLIHHRPETLGQASRITGVSPSDVSVLMVHIGR
jgi:tRNA uridine 5-carboxymethylaminomethyl modification enzyme